MIFLYLEIFYSSELFSYSLCFRLEDSKIPRLIRGLSWVLKFTLIFIFGNEISQKFPNTCSNVFLASLGSLVVFKNPQL